MAELGKPSCLALHPVPNLVQCARAPRTPPPTALHVCAQRGPDRAQAKQQCTSALKIGPCVADIWARPY